LSYQKYAITQQATADATVRAAPVAPETPLNLSDEAARESRKLKVSHTMVGMDAATVQAAVQAAGQGPAPHTPPMPPAYYDPEEDPVDIPTTGLPPTVVGMMVLGALLVAALAGGYLALAP
ncbi:MAG: hypothetical protein KC492_11920, partial [Myxococcales bacterium]|nr:hypothetical protein [Myxococcales bacterium]